jgi:hypothetical protein
MSFTFTFMALSVPTRTTFGTTLRLPAPETPSLSRFAISSIAALLGAQRRIFLVATLSVDRVPFACITCGRLDRYACTNPQMVDVLPVPGGLSLKLSGEMLWAWGEKRALELK